MRLLNFKANNLFSLGDVSISLENKGLTLVTGHSYDEGSANGSGKSSLANKGICWTLFGQTPGGLRSDEVINVHSKGKCRGIVNFEGIDSKVYTVERTRNPNKLNLSVDGDSISRRHEKDTQELINQVLGRDLNTFLQTDFFGQGREISFLSMTPKAQVELLESILPIDKLNEYTRRAKIAITKVQEQLTEVQKQALLMEGSLAEATKNRDELSRQSNTWQTTHDDKVRRFELRIEQTKASNAQLETKIQELEASKSVLVQAFEAIELEKIQVQLAELSEKKVTQETSLTNNSKLLHDWKTQKSLAQSNIKVIKDKVCPTCEQTVNQETTDKLKAEQAHWTEQLTASTTYIERLDVGLDKIKSEIKCTSDLMQTIGADVKTFDDLQRQILSLDTELLGQRQQMPQSIETLIEQIESLKGETNQFESMYINARMVVCSKEVEYEDLKGKVESYGAELVRLNVWSKAFNKDIKTYLIQMACPYLESRASEHLEGLGNPQLKISFSTAKLLKSKDIRDEFNSTVTSNTGGSSFDALSGGEQQMASFAAGLALADLAETQMSGKSRLLILDEPFVSLDERNCENLVLYLSQVIQKKRETILLISNESNLKSLIPERIHVTKRKGISSVEIK